MTTIISKICHGKEFYSRILTIILKAYKYENANHKIQRIFLSTIELFL